MKSIAGGIVMALVGMCGVQAQDRYPSKPIQAVIPLAPGTTTDIVGRAVANKLRDVLGQPVVVQNRPGAGGTIGAQAVVNATPDGYTLFMTNSQHSVNPALYPKLGYDTLRDFSGVAMIAESPALVYQQIAGDKDIRDRFEAQGIVTRVLLLDEFDTHVKADVEKMGALVNAIGTKLQ